MRPIQPLTPAEVRALLAAVPTRSSSGLRLRALIAVMYGSGLRVAEVLALRPADVEGTTVRVRNGKGGKSRTVGLDATCAAVLATWMERRTTLGLTGRHPIFASYSSHSSGRPMATADVRRALARAAHRADLGKRVHPHGLRHSLAFQLANDGVPLHVIQAQLGHSSLATTDRYIRHLNPRQVVDTVAGLGLLESRT